MKKHMFLAMIIAIFCSCTDVMNEIEADGSEFLGQDSTSYSAVKISEKAGYFYTSKELQVWKQRSKNSQFAESWKRIVRNSDIFLSNPEAEIWSHNLQVVTKQPAGNHAVKPVYEGYKLRDAAFRYLLTGETKVGKKVKEILLKQVRVPSVNFGNRSIWAPNIGSQPPSFHCAEWVLTLLFTYDYTRNLFSHQEKKEIEKWFHNAGKFFKENVDYELDKIFVNRWANDYRPSSYAKFVNKKNKPFYTHSGGHKVPVIAAWNFHNRQGSQIRTAAFIGQMVGDRQLVGAAKKFVMECVKFWAFPDGLTTEFERGMEESRPEAGFYYTWITLEQLLGIADLLARNGDFSLFEYKTAQGIYGTEGGAKSLWKVATTLCKLKRGDFFDTLTKSYSIYTTSKHPKYKIDGYDPLDVYTKKPILYAKEIYLAQYNLYFDDPYIRESYQNCLNSGGIRIAGSGPHHNDQGAWGVHASKTLMYADLEGAIWPFGEALSSN